MWRQRSFSRTVPQPIRQDSQWKPYVLHSPGDFSHGLVTLSDPPVQRTLLQLTFLWDIWKYKFLLTLLDINAIRREIANVTQDTTSRHGKRICEKATIPSFSWRTSPRRCIDVRLCESKTLDRVQLHLLLCTMCYPTFKIGNVKLRTPCRNVKFLPSRVSALTSCKVTSQLYGRTRGTHSECTFTHFKWLKYGCSFAMWLSRLSRLLLHLTISVPFQSHL